MARAMKDSNIEWLEDIPANWKLAQLKRFVSVNSGREILEEVDNIKNAVPVYGSGGVFKYTTKPLYDGEAVMFGRKGTLGKPIYANEKFWAVDTMYYLTFSEKLSAKFNYYQLVSFNWEPYITQTALPSIVASEIVSCKFAFPPRDEQRRIVDFLNNECARIDSVIEKTRASIKEYKKLKQAIITHAVTKGIRPNRTLKDSGIEWIGQIPDDWSVRRIGQLYTERKEKVSDVDFLPLSVTMKGILPQLSTVAKSDAHDDRKLVRKGDFAINSRSDRRGSCGISPYDGSVSLINTILTPRNEINPIYYDWLFHSTMFSDEFYKWGHGIVDDLWTTNYQDMKKISVTVPKIEEQREIAAYLDEKTASIDSLIAKKNLLVSELENLKKSLIFEYVTGKKEVPT